MSCHPVISSITALSWSGLQNLSQKHCACQSITVHILTDSHLGGNLESLINLMIFFGRWEETKEPR